MSSGGILYFVGLSSLPPIKLRAQDHHERVESLFLSSEERKEVSVFNHVLGVQHGSGKSGFRWKPLTKIPLTRFRKTKKDFLGERKTRFRKIVLERQYFLDDRTSPFVEIVPVGLTL